MSEILSFWEMCVLAGGGLRNLAVLGFLTNYWPQYNYQVCPL